MSAALSSSDPRPPRDAPEPLRIEFGRSTQAEITALFRALALACIQRQITRVLVIAGDPSPAGEQSLRNAMTTIVLAGTPLGFRLALVAASPRVAHTYRTAQRDFNAAGVTTELFESEEDAARWLYNGNGARRAA